jgi:hypothetical protein
MADDSDRNLVSYLIVALAFGVPLAAMWGMWKGRSDQMEAYERLMHRANLPAACEARIEGAKRQLTFEAQERARLE